MARCKPKNVYPIKDLKVANAALAEVLELKRKIDEVQLKMNEQIDRIKAETEVEVAPLQTRIKGIENGLAAFADLKKEELFSEKRTVEMDFGQMGFRKSSEVKTKPKVTWGMVLGKLKDLSLTAAIRTKETVNKEELGQWPDERLETVGARRVKKDTFWYEVDEEVVKDLAS